MINVIHYNSFCFITNSNKKYTGDFFLYIYNLKELKIHVFYTIILFDGILSLFTNLFYFISFYICRYPIPHISTLL
jgi:hypothetical protein